MSSYTRSLNRMRRNSKKSKKVKKTKKTMRKRGCRKCDCGVTPYVYGGSGFANLGVGTGVGSYYKSLDDTGRNLAYTPGSVQSVGPNPNLAYTYNGKGGARLDNLSLDDQGRNLAYTGSPILAISPNPHMAYKGGKHPANLDPAYPVLNNQSVNTSKPLNWLNSMSGGMKGGCGGNQCPLMKGGDCGCANLPLMKGGDCGCANIVQPMKGGFTGPNGLVGTAWKPDASTWPAVSPKTNHLSYNTYDNDISRQMMANGASRPFTVGGKRIGNGTKKLLLKFRGKRNKKSKGGAAGPNSLVQDFFSLGNQFMFNGQSAFNAIRGVPPPVNPSPTSQPIGTPLVNNPRSSS